MSSTKKTPKHIVPAYNSPRGRGVDRAKVAEAAQETAEAEAPHAAQPAQAAEGWMATKARRIASNITKLPELLRKSCVGLQYG
jgi:hypothetical protein